MAPLARFPALLLAFSLFLTSTNAKVCVGTNSSMSMLRPTTDGIYNFLKTMYTSCTYVDGNVEITHIEARNKKGQEYDFGFLKDIQEIKGYLLLYLVQVPELPFQNLKIIRGTNLFGVKNSAHALYVHNTKLRELRWKNLREIQRGNVTFIDNYDLCYEETINWDDILVKGSFQRKHADLKKKRKCLSCNPVCEALSGPTRNDRHCWGEGPNMCQKLSKVICNAACPGQRCFGPQGDQCCSAQCAGGCTGPQPTECTVCADFDNNGTCLSKCPEKMKYNPKTYTREINPDFRFTYGTTCVKVCPPSYYEDDDTCVRTCSQNKTETEKDNRKICAPCKSQCPKVCAVDWSFNLHEQNLKELDGCTSVQGSITISQTTMTGDQLLGFKPLNYSDLLVLKSIQRIYGYLKVEASAPGFTNLSFLENLEVIMGQSQVQMGHSLWIYGTSLRSLGLNKLKKIEEGIVLIYDNKDLCYADQMNWSVIVKNPKLHQGMLKHKVSGLNRNSTQCRIEKRVCDPECDHNGCWGPGPHQCLNCRNFKLGSKCLKSCSLVNRTYEAGNGMCQFCDDECANSCLGPGANSCDACRHVKDGPYCKKECPNSKYKDPETSECMPCHDNCKEINDHPSCDGPHNTIGRGGCFACDRVFMHEDDSFGECLPLGQLVCPGPSEDSSGFYPLNQPARTLNHRNGTLSRDQAVCKRCNSQCYGCDSFGPNNCRQCRNFEINYSNSKSCVAACPTETHFETGKSCQRCNEECRKGCNGPSSMDCIECFNYYDPIDEEANDNPDNRLSRSTNTSVSSSVRHNCTAECPPHRKFHDSTRVCTDIDPSLPPDNYTRNVTLGSIGGIVFVIVVLIVVSFCYRTQRMRKRTTEILHAMTGDVPTEPIDPSDAEPNMSKLRLIKEEELRKGGVLGSGAFGTVYKGVWLPAGEPNAKIPVAIKVLREGTTASRNRESLDEAYNMASMDHPCLVRLLAVCLTQQMMLITQLMPLGCLLDYVRNNRKDLGSKALLDFCTQIARGMAYLETRRLVHRDLAARNVLVQTPKQVKITDFGLAKLLDVNQDEYTAQGGRMPIKWLALESIQHRTFTHKSDVWSFGVTCWEIFTFGQRPYENVRAREVPELLEKGERLPQPSICSLEVYMLTIKCWMIDPDSRPSFTDLAELYAKMARDPGRYLVIPGDKHLRLPSNTAYAGAIGGDDDFEGIFEDFRPSLSMQDPYLSPGSGTDSSLPPPPYTLQHNNNLTLTRSNNNNQPHPQYRNPPPALAHSSPSVTPTTPATPLPYTDVRPGAPLPSALNNALTNHSLAAAAAAASGSLPRSGTVSRSLSPVSPVKKEPPTGLVVNLPASKHYPSQPSSLSGGVVLSPAFGAAPSAGPRHSSTSPANLASEAVGGAVGGHPPQRTQSKYGNLEHAAANNAMQPRTDSGASRYSSDPTNGNGINPTAAAARATPITSTVLNPYGGFDVVLTHPLPSQAEIHPSPDRTTFPTIPPPLPTALPSSSSGTPYYGELGTLANTVVPVDEDDYLRPQSTINSANNSRDNSAGSVGKEYYSDPKYLNVMTGAIGKLQEVIPISTSFHDPGAKTELDSSVKTKMPGAMSMGAAAVIPPYPAQNGQSKPPLPPSVNSIGIDNPEYFAGPNGNPPSSPASTLSFPTSPTDSLTFLLKTPTKEDFPRHTPGTTTTSSLPSHALSSSGVTMKFNNAVNGNGVKQIHPVVQYHEYYNDYNGPTVLSPESNLATAAPPPSSSSSASAGPAPPASSSTASDKQRLLSSSSSSGSAPSPVPQGAAPRSAAAAPTIGLAPGAVGRLSMRTRKETML